jgi:hypothetical protein
MNIKRIQAGQKKGGIRAGVLAALLLVSGEVWMFCHPGKHMLHGTPQPERAELFPHQDVYLPPW